MPKYDFRLSTTYNRAVGPGTELELAAISMRSGVAELWTPKAEWGTDWVTQPVKCRTDGPGWVQGWVRVQGVIGQPGLQRPMLYVHEHRRGGRLLFKLDARKLRQWVRMGWLEPCGWRMLRRTRRSYYPCETSQPGIPWAAIAAAREQA
jgi:hypothetical protein